MEMKAVVEKPSIDQMVLVVPEDGVQDFLEALLGGVVQRGGDLVQQLAQVLLSLGWNCARHGNGNLVLTEYVGRELDLEGDPVLVSAVGRVKPGSFVLGHAEHDVAPRWWWVSYTVQEKQISWGVPTKEQVGGLLVCPDCGSFSPGDWRHIQYTAINYPVKSVNPLHIATESQGEVLYECVIKEYVECGCGAEIAQNGRTVV